MDADWFVEAREKLKLSTGALALVMFCSERAIRDLERGRAKLSGERGLLMQLLLQKAFSETPTNLVNRHLAPLTIKGSHAMKVSEHYIAAYPLLHIFLFRCDDSLDLIEANALGLKVKEHRRVIEKIESFDEIREWQQSVENGGAPRIK